MKVLTIEMPDGTVWAVPVTVIAADRAKCYAKEFGGDVKRSLEEDTEPLFNSDEYEIKDWAANNMNWEDVKDHAFLHLQAPAGTDYQEGWVNGKKSVETIVRG
jgi:hypothetical protein